jgi:GntR family transcriptional regulator
MALPDRAVPTPLYHQVKSLLLREITSGRWKPDMRLPSEDALVKRFQVSKITVRHALRELAAAGYVRREQGRGTFVQSPALTSGPRALTSFTDEMRRHRLLPSSRIREQGAVPASPAIGGLLGVSAGAPVFRLQRVRFADGEPIGLQTTHLPLDLVPGIGECITEDSSLYAVLRERYGLAPARAHDTHTAVTLDEANAALLHVRPGSAALSVERLALLPDGRPLEFVESLMRGDRYRVELDLVRPYASRLR